MVAGVPDGGGEGGAVPEEGGSCAGDSGYVEGHIDCLVVDDLVDALGEAVPAFWVGFQGCCLCYYAFLVTVVGCSASCERLDVVEGYVEAAGLELCFEVFVVGYELVVVYEASDGLVVEHGFSGVWRWFA